jgi:hypothetical protein
MDEPKDGLRAGRLSCHRLLANSWRPALRAAAYDLLDAPRGHDGVPAGLRRAQPRTRRDRAIEVAAGVARTTRARAGWWSAPPPSGRTGTCLYRAVAARAINTPRDARRARRGHVTPHTPAQRRG